MEKTKKALLINPPTGKYMRDDRCQAPVEEMTAQPARAPMDLAYMASTLISVNVECKIIDCPFEKVTWNKLKKIIKDFNPDYLIISTTTPTLENDMIACNIAKEINKSIITIAKGAQITKDSETIMKKFKELDIAIWGEYEFAVKEIATMKLSKVKGITFRNDNKIYKTEDRPRLENLDLLPLPARDLLNNKLYKAPDTGKPIAYILTGRGCPHRCIYCAVSVASGYKLYTRSVESIIREIEECYYKFKIKDFFFRSDTFTWDEKWVVSLCQKIIEKKIKIRWGTNSRVDTINENRLYWMKKAGCYVIGFGIESGNQEMLNKMKKRITIEQIKDAVNICKKYRIRSYLLFMFGLPWETKESANDTIKLALELDGDFADFNIAYPLPGTEFYEIAKKDKLFNGELTGFDYAKPIVRTYSLTREELIEIRKDAIKKFYFRPKYILKTILKIRSLSELFSYIKQGSFLAAKIILLRHKIKNRKIYENN